MKKINILQLVTGLGMGGAEKVVLDLAKYTSKEVFEKPIQSMAFIESLIIFSFFLYFLALFLNKTLKTFRINIYIFSLVCMALFWLLFVHYPFGILNPGSALRYRENFYGFLVVFLFYVYSKYANRRLKI